MCYEIVWMCVGKPAWVALTDKLYVFGLYDCGADGSCSATYLKK